MPQGDPHLIAVRAGFRGFLRQRMAPTDAQITTEESVAALRRSRRVPGLGRVRPQGMRGSLEDHALKDLHRRVARELPDADTGGHWLCSVPAALAHPRQTHPAHTRRVYKRTAYLVAEEMEDQANRDVQIERTYHSKQATEREAARRQRALDAQDPTTPHYWRDVHADTKAVLRARGETPYNV